MDKLEIIGKPPGSPGAGLRGRLEIRGAKNAALPIQCAALLASSTTRLRHVPKLTDVATMNRLLREVGCGVEVHADGRTIEIGVILLPARSAERQPDPVWFLHGGPGAGAILAGVSGAAAWALARGAWSAISRRSGQRVKALSDDLQGEADRASGDRDDVPSIASGGKTT